MNGKEVVQRFNYEVIQSGKRDVFEALMADEFINWTAPVGAPRDKESMWNTFENVLRPALSNLQVHIHEQLEDGEKVISRKTISGIHTGNLLGIPSTGRTINIDAIDIVTVREGKYVEHWGINTLQTAIAQLKSI